MANTYVVYNAAYPTTAGMVKVATGAAIKTLLQLGTPATAEAKIIQWGISFDGAAAATAILVEFFGCTGAASGGTSVTPSLWENPLGPPSLCVGGTALTCFSPSTEGTVAAYRPFDVQLIQPTAQYVLQFPLGREPRMALSTFARVRVTAPAGVNALCYIVWEE